jgi:hypothetical protein
MRWIVAFAILFYFGRAMVGVLNRARPTELDTNFLWAFNQIFGYQILFGLTLWLAASPFVKVGLKNPGEMLSDPAISFWTLRHPLTMIFALGIFHMGKAFVRKRGTPENYFKYYSAIFFLILVTVASAIPWPGLVYGRDWFRWIS